MFRKIVGILGAGLFVVLPLAISPSARADGPRYEAHLRQHRYVVEYRAFRHSPWIVAGVFHNSRHAHHEARVLRDRGLYTRVVPG